MTDWYSLPPFKTSWKKSGASDLRGVAVSTRMAGSTVYLKGSIVKQMLTLIKGHHGIKLKNTYMQNMYKICATRIEWREPQVQILLNSYEVFLRGGDSLLPVVPTHSLPHVSIRLSKNCRGEQLQVDGGEHAADEGHQRDVWSRIKTVLAYGRAHQLKVVQHVQHFHL